MIETKPKNAFDVKVEPHLDGALTRRSVTTVQINVGKLCNQACHHCHVEAGPGRRERMTRTTATAVIDAIDRSSGVHTVDLTGGAPELNENFRLLVDACFDRSITVIDRCNLTVLFEPGMEWLADYLADRRVRLVCSLPCYSAENVDRQRGDGVFERSIEALRWLNTLGYGKPGSGRSLDLVHNPVDATLPPEQGPLRETFAAQLEQHFGIVFNELLTITNMPIKRFAEQLRRSGQINDYMSLLVNHFNADTLDSLMCRDTVSVAWDGTLHDCDFNQMLEIPQGGGSRRTLDDIASFDELAGSRIATGMHCYGCTAGAGSGCSGALLG